MDFSAVLVAGGGSTRMGRDKAELLVRGVPYWERQIAILRASGAGELFVSGRRDGAYAGSGLVVVEDDEPGRGPLSGLIASLRHARHPLLLVLAVDLPRMTSVFLKRLVRDACAGVGVVPRRGGMFEPLAAVYPQECLELAEQCRGRSELGLQSFVERAVEAGLLQPRTISETEAALFANVNTPQDYREIIADDAQEKCTVPEVKKSK